MLIPPDMRLHLTKHKKQALSPHVRFSWRQLSQTMLIFVHELVPTKVEVASYFVISFSKADIRQLPYPYPRSERRAYFVEGSQDARWLRYAESICRKLLGVTSRSPAVLYAMSKKLAQILSLPLALHNISAPRLRGLRQNDPKVHKSDNVPPEVALISTVIVVIRLVYGLDERTRYARYDEPSPAPLNVLPSLGSLFNPATQPTPSRSWTNI